jgi:transcriptional regulator GlxA family with amidase domain
MPRITALIYPEALATSVTLPMEILVAAGQLSRARRRPVPAPRLELRSADGSDIALPSGLTLSVAGPFADCAQCDLLLLPAIWRHPQRVVTRCGPLLAQLRHLYENGTTICSVGSAANLLAAAGLLDGRAATTHWHDFDAFAQRFPNVDLKRRHLITRSDRLYCAGSVNSIGDVMVHLLGQWYGAGIGRAVEAQFSPEARQAFASAAFLADDAGAAHHDALVREIQDRLQLDLAHTPRFEQLAAEFGLSERSLGRRFRAATGRSPSAWLRERRLQEARALLQHSDLAVGEVAWRCGFHSPSRFSQVFRRELDMTPRAFRAAVRGKRFAGTPP